MEHRHQVQYFPGKQTKDSFIFFTGQRTLVINTFFNNYLHWSYIQVQNSAPVHLLHRTRHLIHISPSEYCEKSSWQNKHLQSEWVKQSIAVWQIFICQTFKNSLLGMLFHIWPLSSIDISDNCLMITGNYNYNYIYIYKLHSLFISKVLWLRYFQLLKLSSIAYILDSKFIVQKDLYRYKIEVIYSKK